MSTGPRTAEGKAISSQNSTRHGLTARTVVTKGENAQEYDQVHSGLLEQYCPGNDRELYFATEAIENAWRLRRAHRIEADTFDRYLSGEMNAGDAFHEHAKEFDRVRRYITSIERAMYRAIKELDLLQSVRFAVEQEEFAAELAEASEPDEFVSQNDPTVESAHPRNLQPSRLQPTLLRDLGAA
ncbi:MAG: hypothetical protein WKF37_08115 [Bryobacteraceae bacterium]